MIFCRSTQLHRLSLASLISIISILSFVPDAYAQNNQLKLLQESNFDAPPTDEGTFGGSDMGGKRADQQCFFAAIMPESYYSSTINNHPTFWVYVQPKLAEDQEQLAMQANLYLAPFVSENQAVADQNTTSSPDDLMKDNFPLMLTIQDSLSESGLISLEVPQSNEGLLPNKLYQWKITVTCDDSYEAIAAKAEANGEDYGMIRLVNSEPIPENAQAYAKQGVWVDTIDALARLDKTSSSTTTTSPNTQALLEEWHNLLLDLETQLSQTSPQNP